jgi:hypothetical protein
MDITLTTPAILFPAVSLLLIAYTNRYLAIARLIRELKTAYSSKKNPNHLLQIHLLKRRERFIRNMQAFAIASLFCCTFSMALIFFGEIILGKYVFAFALCLMLISLAISFRDILMAGGALRIELKEMEDELEMKN